MATEAQDKAFEIEQVNGVTVVRFLRRTILDTGATNAIGERLTALAQQGQARKLVFSFDKVESMTSSMFGRFVRLHQDVEATGGRLAFCNVEPFLLRIFTLCGLPRSIAVLPDVPAAVSALLTEQG